MVLATGVHSSISYIGSSVKIDKKEESVDNEGPVVCEKIEECRYTANANTIMNTKINPQHASNSYKGGTLGRNSPSALLDMLAEVASQTLHSEKKHINSMLALQCKSKTANTKRKESSFTVPQLISMPISHLVKQFTIFTSDELKRQYSYTCALVPGCQQKYTSFASEGKARTSIKNHLEEHLEHFKTDNEAYNKFIVKSVNYKNSKTNMQNKKSRVQQTRKPQETLNKENKNVMLEKSTNYLRKILLHDINIKEIEKQRCFQKSENKEAHNSELKNSEQTDLKVLGDHSYFERLDEKMPNRRRISHNDVLDKKAGGENIVLMVVGTDSVHMKEYSNINQKLSENTSCQDTSNSFYLSDLSWSDENRVKSTEASATTKPKGKAKFIGTSKEEREMALAYMDRIKKKGNPTGNNLQCRICDPPRTFTAPTTLVSHYRSHAGIKPYECRICRAVFTRRHSLKYHMLIHQNQTRFTCADCGKKFRHPSHFREHQRRHTGEAPFGCDDCGQRFKTRNTYKRHLKTRHGKILTTTGELLHLSEEDFQKVRTNRRKKDCVPETTANASNVASNAIVDFISQHNEPQIVEEYVLKGNIDDINRNWETNDTIQVIDKRFENFEICPESHLNKTDGIETEIAVNCRYSDRDDSNIRMECINGIQNDLQLKNSFNNTSEISNERNHVIYQHHLGDQNKVYNYSDVIQSYPAINCSSEILKEEEDKEHKTNIDFPKEQDRNNFHVLQESTSGYDKIIYNNDTQEKSTTYMHLKTQVETTSINENNLTSDEKCNIHIIIAQNDAMNKNSSKYASSFNENKECAGNDITFCTQIANADVNILQTVNEIGEEIILQNQNNILQQNEHVSEYKSLVAASTENFNVSSKDRIEVSQKIDQQYNNQYLYVHTEQLNGIIAQNKCINIPLHQINLCYDQQSQYNSKIMDNCKKIRILNEDIQTINIKQSDKQNAILFVSTESLKNRILQIDRNTITVKGPKR